MRITVQTEEIKYGLGGREEEVGIAVMLKTCIR
jgi:hypothetical protein